jgi:flagellar hook-associated protein 2
MSTVSSSTSPAAATTTTTANAISAAEAAAQAAQQAAAQSIISGATGNSTLDVTSLTTALVNGKIAGQSATLTTEAAVDNTQISAFGTVSAALSALQTAIAGLANGTDLSQYTATTSGTGITATGGAGAVAGSYQVTVSQVATSQALTSGAFSSTAALGTGTMNISVGGQSMSLNVTSANNTLSGIASAINSSASNPGVTATIVTGTDGAHLVLRSNNTGAANTINVSVSGVSDDNGLSSLGVTSTPSTTGGASAFSSSGTIAWSQTTAAQDAAFTIDGTAATSSTNSVTTAIQGVTLDLTAAAVGTGTTPQTQTLTIAQDTTTAASDINNFVSLYNTVVNLISPSGANSLTGFNSSASAGAGGDALTGNAVLTQIQNQLAEIVGGAVGSGSTSQTLAAIGITFDSDGTTAGAGTLTVDSTTLTNALTNDPSTVASLFNSTNGIGEQLNSAVNSYVGSTGLIATQTTAINADLTSVSTQQTSLASYQAQLTAQYQAQFTALNTLMASSNSNSQYLTQLFGGSDSAGSLASANSS